METAELGSRFNLLIVSHALTALLLVFCLLLAWSAWNSFKQQADLFWMGAFILGVLVQVGYLWETLVLKDSLSLLNSSLVGAFSDTTRLRLPFAVFQLFATFATFAAYRARRSAF